MSFPFRQKLLVAVAYRNPSSVHLESLHVQIRGLHLLHQSRAGQAPEREEYFRWVFYCLFSSFPPLRRFFSFTACHLKKQHLNLSLFLTGNFENAQIFKYDSSDCHCKCNSSLVLISYWSRQLVSCLSTRWRLTLIRPFCDVFCM